MPIPLIYFLIAWTGFMVILGIVAILAAIQMLRFGVAGTTTTSITAFFMIIGLAVTLTTTTYLATVDWKQNVDLFSGIIDTSFLDTVTKKL